MRLLATLSLFSIAACGGKIDANADASTDATAGGDVTKIPDGGTDVIVPPPPPPDGSTITCSGKTGEGYTGTGQCGERDEWSCSDGNVYEISCKCPPDPTGQTCACRRNGITTKTFLGNVCPSCVNVLAAAKQCGFPE